VLSQKISSLAFVFFLAANAAWADLSLPQAIDLAVKNNVSVRVAAAQTKQARGKALRDASDLLPKILGTASQSRVFKQNLESMGFQPGQGFNTLVGPYNSFDARLSLVQNIFDLSAIWQAKAGKQTARAAELEEDLAKEQVASAAALAYLDLIRSRRAVEAAQADADLSNSLLGLSSDQHKSGLATGVDVARARTRMAEGNLRLIRARSSERQARLRLARLTGLSFDDPLVTTDALNYSSSTVIAMDQALATAQKDRPELNIASLLYQAQKNSYDSVRALNAPRLYATGDYGLSGVTPDNAKETGSIGAHLEVPIFNGRHNQGATKEAEAALEQAQLRQEDTRRQIEEDVRLAFDTLSAAQEEVATATQAQQFAEQEMKMARDRYSAGVGDNIQIISAQNVVAQADDDLIGAIASYQAARINLDMSLGHAQTFSLQRSPSTGESK
jgi:outer membrane protein TolC